MDIWEWRERQEEARRNRMPLNTDPFYPDEYWKADHTPDVIEDTEKEDEDA